jgi:CheY-like chemotaxis protein
MPGKESYLKGKRILAVDDERDVLETIEEALGESLVDTAENYQTAIERLSVHKYDLAILDIMGVDGLKLLEKTVKKGIPSVMLTAHAMNPETLMTSIRRGAISFLPKEKLAELDLILEDLMVAHASGKATWKILFDELGDYFDEKFGPEWKEKDRDFWSEFSRTYSVSKGVQQRLLHDDKITSKGV